MEFSDLPDPLEIYQLHLDVLSKALLDGVFEEYVNRLHLPYINVNLSATKRIETIEQMRTLFEGLQTTFKAQRVTDYLRIAKEANYVSRIEIHGAHETHLLSHGMRVVQPYPNRMRMKFIDGNWTEIASANAIRLDGGSTLVPKVDDVPVVPDFPSHDQRRI